MPSWKIHDKWFKRLREETAQDAGTSSDHISQYVNLLIDDPQKNTEYMQYCASDPGAAIHRRGKPTKMNVGHLDHHDSGRSSTVLASIQLKFLARKGEPYIEAWYLHQILDYLKWWLDPKNEMTHLYPGLSSKHILTDKRIQKKLGTPGNVTIDIIKAFIENNEKELFSDLSEAE